MLRKSLCQRSEVLRVNFSSHFLIGRRTAFLFNTQQKISPYLGRDEFKEGVSAGFIAFAPGWGMTMISERAKVGCGFEDVKGGG